MKSLRQWTRIVPLLAWILYFAGLINRGGIFQIAGSFLRILSVMAAVHFSETIAHRVGELFGTIILAVAITIIEVSIIVSLMASGGEDSASLARDTVFSAVMLILNGIIGLSVFVGALKFHEQSSLKPQLLSPWCLLFLLLRKHWCFRLLAPVLKGRTIQEHN
jgi:Ca2+:H+ antiporter